MADGYCDGYDEGLPLYIMAPPYITDGTLKSDSSTMNPYIDIPHRNKHKVIRPKTPIRFIH